MGCTEKITVEPTYTNNTSFTPEITIDDNYFNRISIRTKNIMPFKDRRNVKQGIFLYKLSDQSEYTLLKASALYPTTTTGHTESDSIFESNKSYDVKRQIIYRDGTIRESNIVTFTAAEIEGNILEKIKVTPITSPKTMFNIPSYYINDYPTGLGYYNNKLYANNELGMLVELDLSTKQVKIKSDNWYPNFADAFNISPKQNGLIFNYDWHRIYSYNLETLTAVDTIQINGTFLNMVEYGDSLCLISNRDQNYNLVIFEYDIINNAVTKDPVIISDHLYSIIKANNNLISASWFSKLNIRLHSFTPFGFTISKDHGKRIPVYDSKGLAWDGQNYWTYDPWNQEFVKFNWNN